jgi:16S rRNA (cytosine1402-N4)-methyltransferase
MKQVSMPVHEPVLLRETLGFLAPERGGWFVDCTVGLGGHAAALLECAPEAKLLGIDRDREALRLAAERLAVYGDRVRLVPGTFSELRQILVQEGLSKVQGVLADLGVSSMQLDTADRGFSFRLDGPLDMRMGAGELTAAEVVNTYSENALATIFKEYGEERHARRMSRAIGWRRKESPIETTAELRRVLEKAKPSRPGRRAKIHPATRAFQALRIEVNGELDELSHLMDEAAHLLESKGNLVVISYHSLEDRIAKNTLRKLALGEIEPITGRPRAETQIIETLTRKPVRPSEEEVEANPRARSARLRAARRL